MTSKGFFTRAGRDLIDKLPIEGEQLTIYCLHDADAAGTLIFEALSGATKARPARIGDRGQSRARSMGRLRHGPGGASGSIR